ncbi:MAG: asparagine synthase (glutamine-hydrolyzing) [Alphaproteobacteria bacterium]|nr:asparagine synthase (glutamine-hydrolyzing) [Alphaproteobacteria bacterium]
MCGLTGFYTNSNNRTRTDLHAVAGAMARTLQHRGPDAQGLWQDPDSHVVLAHRRLSILDLSAEGAQPMLSPSGRYVIAYNGELYNYQSLQKELEAAGVKFKGRSDTEVFLAGIDHWGLNQSLQKINGMFAFVLWDRKTRQIHLVRDRLGKKPLYIGWAGNTLVFGSELKALRAHPDFKPELDPQALSLYLQHGWLNAPFCIYKNVQALLPGHRMSIDTESFQIGAALTPLMEPYWQPLDVAQNALAARQDTLSANAAIDGFSEILERCVSERMVSDVPLGAFLSGGIDSSAVTALMQANASRPVKTYTIGFEDKGFDEAQHARAIAAHLGTDHHELYLTGADARNTIAALPEIYDEPFADISSIPTYLVSTFARKSVTVALSGDGGDEMLGGYERHLRAPQIWKTMQVIPAPVRRAMEEILRRIPAHYLGKLRRNSPQFGTKLHKAAGIFALGSQEEIYDRLISAWDVPPVSGAHGASGFLNADAALPPGLSFAEKMMLWDTISYLPGDILTKVDRASMAVSLEVRAPLLDRRIFEYVWSLPESFKIRPRGANGLSSPQGKWLLREVLARHVPREMFERPKQGFSIPLGAWLRGPLREWAENLLQESSLQETGLLDVQAIRRVWLAHLNGQGSHETALWNVLMFQAWHARWLCVKK